MDFDHHCLAGVHVESGRSCRSVPLSGHPGSRGIAVRGERKARGTFFGQDTKVLPLGLYHELISVDAVIHGICLPLLSAPSRILGHVPYDQFLLFHLLLKLLGLSRWEMLLMDVIQHLLRVGDHLKAELSSRTSGRGDDLGPHHSRCNESHSTQQQSSLSLEPRGGTLAALLTGFARVVRPPLAALLVDRSPDSILVIRHARYPVCSVLAPNPAPRRTNTDLAPATGTKP